MDGLLLIDKPAGVTSHDVVERIRRRFAITKVGHAGTLDPMATGLLVVLLGKSTRLFSELSVADKEYEATLTLGLQTETGDIEGRMITQSLFEKIDEERIKKVFAGFIGEQHQVPPMYSALKVRGKKLYQLARKGAVVERQPRNIFIHKLELLRFNPPEIEFCIHCSKGTYIRTLAEDIAKALGTCGCLSALRRTTSGPFHIKDAVRLEEINEGHIRNWPG
ncbi:MAG: tRNA pseudouridine(55) synthase TruB [Candidatus Omnitrophota bacterium]